MANLLTKDVKGTTFSPVEALMISGSKVITEGLLSRVPFVGNGNVRSGIVKMILAGLTGGMIKNKFGKVVGTGLMVDGGEDVVRGVFGGTLGLGASNASAEIGGNTANLGQGGGGAI